MLYKSNGKRLCCIDLTTPVIYDNSLDLQPLRFHIICMEKKRPTYNLEAIKETLGSVETLAITSTALRNATALGFDRFGIVEVVAGINRRMFYKSMTTFTDHRLWQDVYHVPVGNMVLYIKFQADSITEFVLVSFKEN